MPLPDGEAGVPRRSQYSFAYQAALDAYAATIRTYARLEENPRTACK